MTAERPLCVVIGAVGGQGGGVLADWLVETAHSAGYPAQSTSIPGVAQRTGATTYYFEIFPDQNPAGTPVFSLFPSAGDVDLVAALEPIEAGRALERGLVTDQTTLVTVTGRIYSTAEKSVAGDGVVLQDDLLKALTAAARRVVALDTPAPASRLVNAAVFGAIIGSGVLPLSADIARAAIRTTGLAIEANLAGFEQGLRAAQSAPSSPSPAAGDELLPAPPQFAPELTAWPDSLRPLVGHALARLVDYQDAAYARQYLQRLRPIFELDQASHGYRLTAEVGRRLGAWMAYEDIIRVAQLKTRPGRLERLRREVAARPGEPVVVTDYFSPSREQVAEILPAGLARLLGGGDGQADPLGRRLRWRTFSPIGYAALRLLAALKPLRPRSLGFARTAEAIELWLDAVRRAAQVDYDLGCQAAQLAVWARGYGDVRSRGLAALRKVLSDWPERLRSDTRAVQRDVAASLRAARYSPDV